MRGTEKQIAWATDIIEQAIERFNELRSEVDKQIDGDTELQAVADEFAARMRSIEDADDVIEDRVFYEFRHGASTVVRALKAMAGRRRFRKIMPGRTYDVLSATRGESK